MSLDFWPTEIVKKPRPFIALTGLFIDENPVHKSVWEGFSKIRRQDRSSLNIKLLPVKHEYPKCKSKRVNYEWYVPKGILKSHWMHKHMEEVPSLIVVFYDMDWDDIQWKDKINDCASLVHIVKKNIHGRSTKIVVVLIQKRVLMPGEDSHTEQKAQVLCQVCELSGNRNLFVLPTTESLYGYITRIEKEFQDLANNYYQTLIKKVKSHKEALNKTTHLLLFIRHHFKIAFYQEFRQEHALALKNYKQAYSYLRELRLLDTHLLEIKTVAGYINYKICSLSFQNNASDAINQFRIHTDVFKGVCGNPELAFEHETWISKQFEVMADLFRDAIRQGLTAITTQHPGLYYEEAALHAIARKRFSHQTMISSARCMNRHYLITDVSYITNDILIGNHNNNDSKFDIKSYLNEPLEFYGQRPWRPGKQSIEISDPIKEKEAINALRIIEKHVDHSKIIIPLLTNAMDHYQKYKANRMKLMSCVLMGEEYISSNDYQQALKCFSKVMTEYRYERWNSLLLPALLNSLKCTYMIALMPDYISLCLELVKEDNNLNSEEKVRIENNLVLVLNDEPPEPEFCSSNESKAKANELWKNKIKDFNENKYQNEEFLINMDGISSCVDCKIVFPIEKFPVNEPVKFSVHLKSSTSLELTIQNVQVLFLDERYNSRYRLVEKDSNVYPITLNKSEPMKSVAFVLIPISDDGNHVVKVDKLRIQLGSSNKFGHAFLQWSVNFEDYIRQAYCPWEPIEFGPDTTIVPWTSIFTIPFVELIPRSSEFDLNIAHCDPVLINEKHSIEIALVNRETQSIHDVIICIQIEDTYNAQQKARFITPGQLVSQSVSVKSSNSKKIELQISTIEPREKITENVSLVSTVIGKLQIYVEISYKLKIQIDNYTNLCQCIKSEMISTSVVHPFEVMTKVLSEFMIPMKDVIVDEPFLFQVTSSNVSSVALEIEKTEIILNDELECLDDPDNNEDRLNKICVNALEAGCEIFMLKISKNYNEDKKFVPVGQYIIHWKRVGSELNCNKTIISLPDCSLDLMPLSVDLEMDSHGVCRIPLTLTYILRNKTLFPLEIETHLDMSDNFMYSGIKLMQQRILPNSIYPISFRLLPLFAGIHQLPKFRIKLLGFSATQLLLQNNKEHTSSSTTIGSLSVQSNTMTPDSSIVNHNYSKSFDNSELSETIVQMASNEKLFEQRILSRIPNFVFVKPAETERDD